MSQKKAAPLVTAKFRSCAVDGWEQSKQRGGPEPAAASRYFLTVHVMVVSSQVPLALSQSALVFGASWAKAGAATASRRPVMTAKLSVFMSVSYLLEGHLHRCPTPQTNYTL